MQKDWLQYLDNLTNPPVQLDLETAQAVRQLWAQLVEKIGTGLCPPIAGPGGELQFHFTWRSNVACVDIDIASDGSFEWFWVDHRTSKYDYDGSDGPIRELPESLASALTQFFTECTQ